MNNAGPAFVAHVRRSLASCTDERTRAIRLAILALAEATLAGPAVEPISQKGDSTMRFGVLYPNKKGHAPAVAVAIAKAQFQQADHTMGMAAAECRFHPKERPPEDEIGGLKVRADATVPRGHVRICTEDDGVRDELESAVAA